MPQELELVYEVETGMPAYMHSVDAHEAVLLGDYVRTPPRGMDVDPRLIAAAKARAKGMNAEIHPEMLPPEERQRRREEANQQVLPAVAVPMGTPVVLQEGESPAPSALRQQAQHAQRSEQRRMHEEEQKAQEQRQADQERAQAEARDRQQQARQAQQQAEKK